MFASETQMTDTTNGSYTKDVLDLLVSAVKTEINARHNAETFYAEQGCQDAELYAKNLQAQQNVYDIISRIDDGEV